MAIPTPPAAPNPLGTNFAAEALAFTQWMQAAAPEFNTAVSDANQAVMDAQTDGGAAVLAAETARDDAQGYATDADTARGLAVIARGLAEDARDAAQGFAGGAEDARDMAQTYAALAGASAGLPALAGQALKQLQVKSDETGVQWVVPVAGAANIARSLKTTAYTLVAGDKGALIDCTGTWTLGFDAAATLGAGWWCYVRNVGTGTITADPNGAELIDGVTSGAIRPGMTLLIQCDGAAFHCVRLGPRVAREVLTSGTSWTAPLGVRAALLRQSGGGAGGFAAAGGSSGSAGGYLEAYIATTPGASYTYAIGAAGAAGGAGGTTTFTANGITYTSTGGLAPGSGFVQSAPGTSSNGSINARGCTGDAGQSGSPVLEGGMSPIGYGSGGKTNMPGLQGAIVLEY